MPIVGLAQLGGQVGDEDQSQHRSSEAVRALHDRGAELVVLPELAVPGYTLDPQVLAAFAEPLDGATVSTWCSLAKELDTTIVGGFCERGPGRPYNSVAVVDGSGVLLHYRKLHLFGAEKEVFTPGNLGLPIADTSVGRIGVCVCYDLRFVEVVRTLALRGAEIVCVPSAWVGGFDAASDSRTHGCAQSDGAQLQANLNQVFVACAARSGIGQDMTFLGSSLLVDPTGSALMGPASRTQAWSGTHSIDLGDVRKAQDRGGGITPRADRRTDVYRLVYDQELL
jgi:N-carbamoylputrescine amidase